MLGGHIFVAHFYCTVVLLDLSCSKHFHTIVVFKIEHLHASSFLQRLVAAYKCIQIKIIGNTVRVWHRVKNKDNNSEKKPLSSKKSEAGPVVLAWLSESLQKQNPLIENLFILIFFKQKITIQIQVLRQENIYQWRFLFAIQVWKFLPSG